MARPEHDILKPDPSEDGFDSRRNRADDWHLTRNCQPPVRRLQKAAPHPTERLHPGNPQPRRLGITDYGIERAARSGPDILRRPSSHKEDTYQFAPSPCSLLTLSS